MSKKQTLIQLSNYDLNRIKDVVRFKYKDLNSKGLEPEHFIIRCYFDSVIEFLNNNGFSVEVNYEDEREFTDTVGDDD